MSKRETLMATILTAIDAGVTASVVRSRQEAVTRGEGVIAMLEPVSDIPEEVTIQGNPINWSLTFQVLVAARGAVPDTTADTTIAAVYAAVMGSAAIGALVIGISPGPVRWEFDKAEFPLGLAYCQFSCRYRTAYATIT